MRIVIEICSFQCVLPYYFSWAKKACEWWCAKLSIPNLSLPIFWQYAFPMFTRAGHENPLVFYCSFFLFPSFWRTLSHRQANKENKWKLHEKTSDRRVVFTHILGRFSEKRWRAYAVFIFYIWTTMNVAHVMYRRFTFKCVACVRALKLPLGASLTAFRQLSESQT